MTKCIFIFTCIVFFAACNTKQQDKPAVVVTAPVIKETPAPVVVDTIELVVNPFEKIKDFTIDFFGEEYKKQVANFNKNKHTAIKIKPNFCEGDCCYDYKNVIFEKGKAELFLSKHMCGEYGFGNDQYYTENNVIKKVRMFTCYSNDKGPGFISEEQIFIFKTDSVTIKTRKKLVENRNNFSLSELPFSDSTAHKNELMIQHAELLDEKKAALKIKS